MVKLFRPVVPTDTSVAEADWGVDGVGGYGIGVGVGIGTGEDGVRWRGGFRSDSAEEKKAKGEMWEREG